MTGRSGGGGRRVLLPPIQLIFKFFQNHTTVRIWLYERKDICAEGKIMGFDEFMNLVLYDAVEVKLVSKTREKEERISIGKMLLKGDNVALIQQAVV